MFRGVYPALVTPFTAAGDLDWPAAARLIDFHLEAGVDGFYVGGTTGEGLLQDVAKRVEMARRVVEYVNGRAKVVAQVAAIATEDAANLARQCEAAGVDGLSAVPPIFYRMDFEGIYQYYRSLASATPLPFLVYYIPVLTGVAHNVHEIGRLLEIPQIQGLKFSDYNLFMMQSLRHHFPQATILSGNDEVMLPALVMGAHGAIGLTLNFMPGVYAGIFKAYAAGDWMRARELQFAANRVTEIVVRYGAIGAAKAVLKMMGFDCGLPRSPVPAVVGPVYDRLRQELEAIGFFDSDSDALHASCSP